MAGLMGSAVGGVLGCAAEYETECVTGGGIIRAGMATGFVTGAAAGAVVSANGFCIEPEYEEQIVYGSVKATKSEL